MKRICGSCKHHRPDGPEWICSNENCDMYACYTGYEDRCDDWEGRYDTGEDERTLSDE